MALVSVLIALAITTPALPAPSDCLWNAAGERQRQAWLSQYNTDPAGLLKTTLAADLTASLAAACKVPGDKVRNLLVARTMENGAEAFWDRDMQNSGALGRSWEGLSEAHRVQLRRWAATAIVDGNGEESELDGLPAFAKGAGLTDPNGPGMRHLMGYMLGRGYRELAS
ncbi:hypothetical protein [Caulobacter sp. NIBR1757]|uniref:hypothetical protein n=1 Tax=Caulobacter sp. NIBR1757 TaxID=3016000 RepID=UPI0022F1019F|nr:hypothetical protein [Caulobacter sp. NIBR1757]WGM37948.1 hypothetical protein AMEJIAPC_00849 [Caulobacter sp. NIBR1757]